MSLASALAATTPSAASAITLATFSLAPVMVGSPPPVDVETDVDVDATTGVPSLVIGASASSGPYGSATMSAGASFAVASAGSVGGIAVAIDPVA